MYVAQTHSRTIAVQKYKKKLIYAKKKLFFLFIIQKFRNKTKKRPERAANMFYCTLMVDLIHSKSRYHPKLSHCDIVTI